MMKDPRPKFGPDKYVRLLLPGVVRNQLPDALCGIIFPQVIRLLQVPECGRSMRYKSKLFANAISVVMQCIFPFRRGHDGSGNVSIVLPCMSDDRSGLTLEDDRPV